MECYSVAEKPKNDMRKLSMKNGGGKNKVKRD